VEWNRHAKRGLVRVLQVVVGSFGVMNVKAGLSHNLWARAGAEVRSLEAGGGRLRRAKLISRNHTAAPPCGGKKGDPQGGRALAREKQLVTKEKNHSRRAANFSCWPGTHGGIPKFAAEE
jgi:hypothetical protein